MNPVGVTQLKHYVLAFYPIGSKFISTLYAVGMLLSQPKRGFIMRNLLLLLSFIFFAIHSSAQVTFILESIPEDTPREASFYLAGNVNSWMANNPSFQFQPNEFGMLSLVVGNVPDTLEYKICRGNTLSVEVDSLGVDIASRIFTPSMGETVVLKVAGWRDRFPTRQLEATISKNVFFTPTSIEIPQLGRRRTVRMYFPPNYSSRQGFPVIYMLDGQNAFDRSTAMADEWRVDETLDSLFRTKAFGAIVVAIYHGENDRLNEHTPWPNEEKEGGDGQKMLRFIVRDLKPYIDKHYRTYTDSENTLIMGSSYGGLLALFAALEYPKVFGNAAVFSPQLDWSPEIFKRIEKHKKRGFQRIYLLAGQEEGEEMVENLQQAYQMLEDVGFSTDNELRIKVAEEGRHSEWFWAREFPLAVRWLFGF